MPVGNVPIVNIVLDWVFDAGLTDVLILVPPESEAAISEHLQLEYSSNNKLHITLKNYTDGEDDEDEEDNEKIGTARLLKQFRSYIKPTESVKDSEEKLLVATDKETDELLLIEPLETLEEDFSVRMSLLESHPSLSLSTRLLDAHVYVFRRTVLDLLATRRGRDLSSVREQFVPWLVKGAWQEGLGHRWAPSECRALLRSTATSYKQARAIEELSAPSSVLSDHTPLPSGITDGEELADFKANVTRGGKSARRRREPIPFTCRVIIHRPEVPEVPEKGKKSTAPEPEYIIRANSLPGYWEVNRRVVRNLAAQHAAAQAGNSKGVHSTPLSHQPQQPSGPADEISASAQISPDSLVGEGSRVGDRASIKKCIVGRHCNIGRGAKLTNCVLWDWVTVEENARLENVILCPHVRIGEKANIKDCEFGPGFEAKPGDTIKGERLIAGQEA
ncbi:translation initiation factor [Trichosporon asahii var. asahii CBS 8904]|uniref:Translation initiation factor eIF2B subunit gamma n=1 Tax=Trichosporon asahii var. asahii (strain CBS 8904) TaxID=1220162 RepID=K1VEN2_TRIAC|nr:translation initiation factor [Trichosporon asahii var. asahii CBS 8904]